MGTDKIHFLDKVCASDSREPRASAAKTFFRRNGQPLRSLKPRPVTTRASCCTPTPDAQDPTLSTQSHTTSCGDCRLARSGGDGQTRGDAGPAGGPAPDPPHIRRACWVRQRELLAGQQRAHVSSRPRWAGRLRALSTASQPCARPPRCAAPIFGCPSPASMCSRSLCCNRYIFMNAFA